MKTIKHVTTSFLILLYVIASLSFQGCKPDDKEDDECEGCEMVYKPNIYIYPTEQIDLTVKLNFPLGGHVVTSIPEYGKGWNVNVNTSGLINNTYTYLFYESTQPNVWQDNSGWVVETANLESFFRQNMADYGFKDNEIEDFIEYWIPRLDKHSKYSIYPQFKSLIDSVIQLDFSLQPARLLRLFYVIKADNKSQEQLSIPTINSFARDEYFVTEWGVIL